MTQENSVIKKLSAIIQPLALWAFSGIMVVTAIAMSTHYLKKGGCGQAYFGYKGWFALWDGQWYNWIAKNGYAFSQTDYGPQVFFPFYPLLGFIGHWLTGFTTEVVLLAISWMASLALAYIWLRYTASHVKKLTPEQGIIGLALILFFPAAYIMRVDYTESVFMLLMAIFLLGMQKKWPLWVLVLICGLLTATRPTGAICAIVMAVHCWKRFKDKRFLKRAFFSLLLGAISAWGLYAYMGHLGYEYGNPILFIEKQAAWSHETKFSLFEILLLKPIWFFIVEDNVIASGLAENLLNRISWAIAIFATIIGIIKRWLTLEEIVYCVLSLLLFYIFCQDRNLNSMGRYVMSVLPIFIVLARMVSATGVTGLIVVMSFFASFLFYNAGMFNVMHCMY